MNKLQLRVLVVCICTFATLVLTGASTTKFQQDPFRRETYIPSGTFPTAASPTTTGTLTHTGAATVTGTTKVVGSLSVDGGFTAVGASTVQSTLDVSGVATFATDAGVTGNLRVGGVSHVVGASTVGGTLGVTGVATFSTDAGVTGNLGVTGTAYTTGLRVGASGQSIAHITRTSISVGAADAGVAAATCDTPGTVALTQAAALNTGCFLSTPAEMVAGHYSCKVYPSSAGNIGVECCCNNGASGCTYIAAQSTSVWCVTY